MDKAFVPSILSGSSSSENSILHNPYQATAARTSTQKHASAVQPAEDGGGSVGGLQVGPERFHAKPITTPHQRKTAARAALVGFKEQERALLAECFRQFGIETSAITSDAAARLSREKFEACVLALEGGADEVMEAARGSRSNSRCVIFGVGGSAREAMKFSKYGINAIFPEPLERPAMLKLVRATRMLVMHEFRRYVRIPIVTEVTIAAEGRRASATSVEMSSGGMSLQCSESFSTGESVEVSFALMTLPRMSLRGAVSWKRTKSIGIRFDPGDKNRARLKAWIDSYLEN
jgi:Tfp pilus assembly protein PilZ